MNLKKLLIVVTCGILLLSLISLEFVSLPHPWLRLFTSGIYFVFALTVFQNKNLFGLAIFFLLTLCDSFFLFWEFGMAKAGYYLLHIISMAILVYLTIREIKWPTVTKFETFSILIFFLINTFILLYLGSFFNNIIQNLWIRGLFYTNGFLIIILALSAFLYSIRFANDVSAFLFVAIIGLTISDLLLFGIYFTNLKEFRFIDNIFYSIGLYFLLQSYLEYKKLRKIEGEPL